MLSSVASAATTSTTPSSTTPKWRSTRYASGVLCSPVRDADSPRFSRGTRPGRNGRATSSALGKSRSSPVADGSRARRTNQRCGQACRFELELVLTGSCSLNRWTKTGTRSHLLPGAGQARWPWVQTGSQVRHLCLLQGSAALTCWLTTVAEGSEAGPSGAPSPALAGVPSFGAPAGPPPPKQRKKVRLLDGACSRAGSDQALRIGRVLA